MPKVIRRVLALALPCLLAACATGPSGPAGFKDTSKTFTTVVVDAGHGGRDNGANRRFGGSEKVATLDVAKRLNQKLRESQLNTVMTRTSDVFVELGDRVVIENRQKNSIFVSIHFNDSTRRRIHGYETYYHAPASRELATRILKKLMTMPRSTNRGVHFANFRVLKDARYPAVLVECGFLSNRGEGGKARSSEYRDMLADRIAEAIVEQRFGPGVYGAPPVKPPAEGPAQSPSPGIAPSRLKRN